MPLSFPLSILCLPVQFTSEWVSWQKLLRTPQGGGATDLDCILWHAQPAWDHNICAQKVQLIQNETSMLKLLPCHPTHDWHSIQWHVGIRNMISHASKFLKWGIVNQEFELFSCWVLFPLFSEVSFCSVSIKHYFPARECLTYKIFVAGQKTKDLGGWTWSQYWTTWGVTMVSETQVLLQGE